jgi:hypothetical protein
MDTRRNIIVRIMNMYTHGKKEFESNAASTKQEQKSRKPKFEEPQHSFATFSRKSINEYEISF